MARTIKVRGRNRSVKKPVYLPEARASGEAVERILEDAYGEQPWIHQVVTAVTACVHRGVSQLSGSAGPSRNSQPGEGYVMPARTREEILGDMANTVKPSESPGGDWLL